MERKTCTYRSKISEKLTVRLQKYKYKEVQKRRKEINRNVKETEMKIKT